MCNCVLFWLLFEGVWVGMCGCAGWCDGCGEWGGEMLDVSWRLCHGAVVWCVAGCGGVGWWGGVFQQRRLS